MHYPHVFFIVLVLVAAISRFPLFVRTGFHHEVVLGMVRALETQFADLDRRTEQALVPAVIDQSTFTTCAFEWSVVSYSRIGFLSFFLFLLFLESFGFFLQILQRIRSPIGSTQLYNNNELKNEVVYYWACDLLVDWHFVFDPYFDAVGVQVPSAPVLTVSQIIFLFHVLMTHTTHFIFFKNHSRHFLSFVRLAFVRMQVRYVLLLPVIQLSRILWSSCISILNDLRDFSVYETELPQQRIPLSYPEYLDHSVYLSHIKHQ